MSSFSFIRSSLPWLPNTGMICAQAMADIKSNTATPGSFTRVQDTKGGVLPVLIIHGLTSQEALSAIIATPGPHQKPYIAFYQAVQTTHKTATAISPTKALEQTRDQHLTTNAGVLLTIRVDKAARNQTLDMAIALALLETLGQTIVKRDTPKTRENFPHVVSLTANLLTRADENQKQTGT